jgi:hypothetical protein
VLILRQELIWDKLIALDTDHRRPELSWSFCGSTVPLL